MNHALSAKTECSSHSVSTILSDQVMIPIGCSHCNKDTEVSLQLLKQQSAILCEHCYEIHPFSSTDLRLTRLLLAQAGYYFAL